jgi:hypothetical protein
MQWIANYWYVIVLGLVAAMFLFGHKTKKEKEGKGDTQDEEKTGGKTQTSDHSCCH